MNLRGFLQQAWRFVVLAIGLTALSMVARALLPRPSVFALMTAPADPTKSLLSLFFVYGLYALVMQYIAFHARTGGWRLFLALDSLYAGCGSIMLQIETLFFRRAFPQLSSTDTLLILLDGVIVGTAFSALVIAVMGKWRTREKPLVSLGAAYIANWRTVVGAMIVYPIIYFLFGYFVAYGSHATVQFYAAATHAMGGSARLVAFQILRGALWVAFVIPIANVLTRREQTVVAIAGGLPLFSGLALIFENPVMPEAVRYSHGFELTTSMTLFGLLVALSLTARGLSTSVGSQASQPG